MNIKQLLLCQELYSLSEKMSDLEYELDLAKRRKHVDEWERAAKNRQLNAMKDCQMVLRERIKNFVGDWSLTYEKTSL